MYYRRGAPQPQQGSGGIGTHRDRRGVLPALPRNRDCQFALAAAGFPRGRPLSPPAPARRFHWTVSGTRTSICVRPTKPGALPANRTSAAAPPMVTAGPAAAHCKGSAGACWPVIGRRVGWPEAGPVKRDDGSLPGGLASELIVPSWFTASTGPLLVPLAVNSAGYRESRHRSDAGSHRTAIGQRYRSGDADRELRFVGSHPQHFPRLHRNQRHAHSVSVTSTPPRLVGSMPWASNEAATGSNGPRHVPRRRISSPGAAGSCTKNDPGWNGRAESRRRRIGGRHAAHGARELQVRRGALARRGRRGRGPPDRARAGVGYVKIPLRVEGQPPAPAVALRHPPRWSSSGRCAGRPP